MFVHPLRATRAASVLVAQSSFITSRTSQVSIKLRMSSTSAPVKLNDPSLWISKGIIDGKPVDATDGSTFTVTDPGNGKVIGSVPDMNIDQVRVAVDAANKTFKSWSKKTAKERHDIMMKLYQLLIANSDDLAKIITVENGKPLADAKGEVVYGSSFIEWFAEEAVRDRGDTIPSPMPHIRNVVIKQGVGVCGIITPWNFPLAMITRKVGAALAAGATCVVKAPQETPYSALAFTELAKRAGIPDGAVNVITTEKHMKEVGKEICENSTIRKVSFTGSTAVGKLLMAQSASTMKKLSFELGGNAPFIVFDDADIDKAVDGAIACKFRSSGQTCVCANRIYVQSGIYEEFAARMAAKVEQFKVGYGLDEGTTHGPLIKSAAVDKVEKHVQDAKENGGKVLVGGRRMDGLFFEPTVISEVTHCAMSEEETFGPVAGLYKFDSESEVVRLANDTPVGLAGYFFTKDIGRAWRVAEELEVGMVGVNTGIISQTVIPFGGVKESGFGREGSHYGLAEYQVIKYIGMAVN